MVNHLGNVTRETFVQCVTSKNIIFFFNRRLPFWRIFLSKILLLTDGGQSTSMLTNLVLDKRYQFISPDFSFIKLVLCIFFASICFTFRYGHRIIFLNTYMDYYDELLARFISRYQERGKKNANNFNREIN